METGNRNTRGNRAGEERKHIDNLETMALIDKIPEEDREKIDRIVKGANLLRKAIESSRMNESKRNMELEELHNKVRRELVKIFLKYPQHD